MAHCHGRVLVVDDLPDVRVTLSGLLSDEGYQVRSASSSAEALHLLDAERFHVAILDIRLDESDEANQDGLQLMHKIQEIDPNVAIIMLTGYATVKTIQEALQPGPSGRSPAFGFLEKNDTEHLPEWVGRAFDHLEIDRALEIYNLRDFLSALSAKLRFGDIPQPPTDRLEEEAEELLRKLFFGCKRLEVQSILRGYSDAVVFEIIPWYKDNGRGETLIAKIGDPAVIEDEVVRYKSFMQGMVGGHRLPKALEVKRTRSLAGIVYTFAGLGKAEEFTDFYIHSDISDVLPVIENLFIETCFPWRLDSALDCLRGDLRAEYMPLLHLNAEKLQRRLHQIFEEGMPFVVKDVDDDYLPFNQTTAVLNPVAFVLSADLTTDYVKATIHGDLYGHNVLVDRRKETWLIDFARACKGPILQDYASFEIFLRITSAQCTDWDKLQVWEQSLLDIANLSVCVLPAELATDPAIQKAHRAVLKIRELAFRENMQTTEKAYLISLLFNALKSFTVMSLPAIQRYHALFSAALIAEKLHTLNVL